MPTLDFKGKPFVYSHHLSVPFRELVVDASKSVPPAGEAPGLDGNLIIHGDNLEALKALLPRYAGKVDVIYIDPPYNTGNEGWAYNDNVNAPQLKAWLGKTVDADDMERHDKWLCMMWPRLQLLRELLADSGTILISINNIEVNRLTDISHEIFGEENFIGTFIWKSRQNKDNRNEDGFSDDHEYVLAYGGGFDGELRSGADYSNPDDDERGPWASGNMVGLASKTGRPNLHYDLVNPATTVNYGCPSRGWRFEPATMERLIAEGRVLWPAKDTGRPRQKVFLSEMTARTNVSSVIRLPVYTKDGTSSYFQVMGDRDFDFPKPPQLIEYFLSLRESKDLLVLDSFAGSGSTGEAVLSLNNKDSGSRRFILIEQDDYAYTRTAERVARVIRGYTRPASVKKELLRIPLTLTRLKNSTKLFEQVDAVEAESAARGGKLSKAVKDGDFTVSLKLDEELEEVGLGGNFTYCELGEPMDMERFFAEDGKAPSWDQVARYVAYTATGETLTRAEGEDGFAGHAGPYRLHLLYRDDPKWMRSNDAMLDLTTAERIAAAAQADGGKPVLVFAAGKLMGQRALTDLGITFCQLPYSVHRILGDGTEGVAGVDAA